MDGGQLRILVHSIVYRPEPIGSGTYTAELCEWLARRGHAVRVVCPPPYYPHWKVQEPYHQWRYSRETVNGIRVTRCPLWLPKSPGGLQRVLHEISFALFSFPALLIQARRRLDVILVVEPSFFNAIVSLIAAWLCRAAAWLHIQDFELDIAFGLGQFRRSWLRGVVSRIESWVMKRFDVVSTISKKMLERVADKGVPEQRRVLFPNWVDTGGIMPLPRPSPLRIELGIPADRFVALFSGTLGVKQNAEILIEAARLLAPCTSIEFIICGSGPAVASLKQRAADLPAVRFLPLQPLCRLNDLLNVADVHLLSQNPAVADLVMPSKLLGMLSSGRPVIATVGTGTEVGRVVAECGIIVPPEDPRALADSIRFLAENPAHRLRLGRQARQFAVNNLDHDEILAGFERALYDHLERLGNESPETCGSVVPSPLQRRLSEMSASAVQSGPKL